MGFDKRGETLPGIVAAADLTAAQHRFITISAAGKAALTGAGARIDAVLENNPNIDQAASLLGPGSVAKVEASAAISIGDDVSAAANGKAATSATTQYIAGVALTAAGADTELISVWLTMPGRLA